MSTSRSTTQGRRTPQQPSASRQRREQQRQSAVQRRAQEQLEGRRRRWRRLKLGTAATTTLGLVIALVLVFGTGTSHPRNARGRQVIETIPFAPAVHTGLSSAPPPWPLPQDARFDITNAGLNLASSESTVVHYHAHLDIIDNGTPVTVPAGVGFVTANGQTSGVSALHTHDTSNVVHIESPTKTPYTLGQFFTEWGVAIRHGRVGGLVTGNGEILRVFVDGHPFSGDPAGIVFKAHQEIAIWYGPATATPHAPSTYAFPSGE